MKYKYKIGDRVKLIKISPWLDDELKIGKTYTIIGYYSSNASDFIGYALNGLTLARNIKFVDNPECFQSLNRGKKLKRILE